MKIFANSSEIKAWIINDKPSIKLYAVNLECREPYELVKFYADLFSWEDSILQ